MSTDTIQAHTATDLDGKASDTGKPEVYKVGWGRKIVLWITFMLFLPFFISMPVMIFMRIARGHPEDTISLGFIFLLSFIGITFIVLQIVAAGRQRIELHNDKVTMELPTWRGPTPTGPSIKSELPYGEIASIEKRGEIYAFLGVLGMREVSSIISDKGDRIVLGYVAEDEADAPVPYNQVTNSLSERTGKPVTHKGAVNAGTQLAALFKGAPSWDTPPIDTAEVEKARKRAKTVVLMFILAFTALVIAGLGIALYPEIKELISPPQ